MGRNTAEPVAEERPIFENPGPALTVALVTTGLAFALTWQFPVLVDGAAIWRTVLLVPGLLAAGFAVYQKPRSSVVLLLAALAAGLASMAIAVPITHRGVTDDATPAKPRDGSLTAVGHDLAVNPTQYYSPVVLATFDDPEVTNAPPPAVRPSAPSPDWNKDFTAMILWGDGQSSVGLVLPGKAGGLVVKGSHPFKDEGFYPGQVRIAGPHDRQVAVNFTAEVATWDSVRLLLRVLAVFGACAALVVLLPRLVQRAVVSVLIVFHFGGICSAITNIDPAPWLSHQLWTYVYRPYLQFLYMNNAYHYYSPDPGPASLLWFRVEYGPAKEIKDVSLEQPPRVARWIQVASLTDDCDTLDPDGKPFRLRVEYTRRLSLAESVNQKGEIAPMLFAEREMQRRLKTNIVPYYPGVAPPAQYTEPPPVSKQWIKSYVRHVARTWSHPAEHPDWKVLGIKVYLVRQSILDPDQLASKTVDNPQGEQNPNDITTFQPVYAGDFDADGQMKASCLRVEVMGPSSKQPGYEEEKYRDPLLYWLIPIYRELKPEKAVEIQNHPERKVLLDLNRDYILHDYLTVQAGDAPWTKQGQGNAANSAGQDK